MATFLVIYVIYAQVVSQDYSSLSQSMEGREVCVGGGDGVLAKGEGKTEREKKW